MKMKYNEVFLSFLGEYNLPTDLSFPCDIPNDVLKILDDEILQTEQGITLKSLGRLREPKEPWETRTIIEDRENHFHVDLYAPDEKEAFKLGIKTLVLMAKKFATQKIAGVRFWYSFQTPSLGLKQASDMQLHSEDDEYFISDRLSFYQKNNDDIMSPEQFSSLYFAILIIDI